MGAMHRMKALTHTGLDAVTAGTMATVLAVQGDDDIAKRLIDLGFWPGTQVRLIRRAPLGDPIELRLRGFRLALRCVEAARVVVTTGTA